MSREASSPPAWARFGERGGGGVSLDVRLLRASAPLSLQLLWELGRGRLLNCSGLPLPAPLPWLLLSAHRRTLDDVVSWEKKFRRTAASFDPQVVPDLRIEEYGRIGELALGRTALVTMAVALVPLTVRGQEVESVEGGHPLVRCPSTSGRDLRIAPAPNVCALVLGETGLDPRIDTALAVTGRGLLTATDHVDSVHVPPLVRELAVTRSPASFS